MRHLIMKKIFYSIGIISVWWIALFIRFYPDKSGLGDLFIISYFYIFTAYFAVGIAAIVLLLKLLNLLKLTSFFYIFSGTLNISIGIIEIVILLLSRRFMEVNFFLLFSLSLLLGLVILADLFLNYEREKGSGIAAN